MVLRNVKVFKDTAGIADFIAGLIKEFTAALTRDKRLSIALSGGKTPKAIFDHINGMHKDRIDWGSLGIFQVDERCVPPCNPESNFSMINDSLLCGLDFPEKQLFRMIGENDPVYEANRYATVLSENLVEEGHRPVLDVIMLGLGIDGHTASLFPNDKTILHSEKFAEVSSHPESGQKRITLTLPVINNARLQLFVVTGADKASIIREVLLGTSGEQIPASMVQSRDGEQIWLLDRPAATQLQSIDSPGIRITDHSKVT